MPITASRAVIGTFALQALAVCAAFAFAALDPAIGRLPFMSLGNPGVVAWVAALFLSAAANIWFLVDQRSEPLRFRLVAAAGIGVLAVLLMLRVVTAALAPATPSVIAPHGHAAPQTTAQPGGPNPTRPAQAPVQGTAYPQPQGTQRPSAPTGAPQGSPRPTGSAPVRTPSPTR